LTIASGVFTVAMVGIASAHVTVNPEQAAQGESTTVTFRVPNERPNAGTVKVKVVLPPEYPLSSVRTKPIAGWTAQIEKSALDRPVESGGKRITESVRAITWTANPGVRIGPDEFNEFEANLGSLPSNTDRLVMPTEQTYDNGEVVKWDTPTPPGGEEPEHPAPTLKLVAGESGHKHGAAESPASPAGAGDDTARRLAGAGLAVGALGLGLGTGALVRSRRRQS
jgi:periplasmic copper chaperone A